MKLKIITSTFLILLSMTVYGQEVQSEIEGGLKIGEYVGDSTQANAGILRWNGTDFQGWNGLDWRSLTSYILKTDSGVSAPVPDTSPPATSAPSSPLNNTRLTEGALWSIDGNYGSALYNIPLARLGTTDYYPVSFITNNKEWMRIREDGDIIIKRNIYLNTEQPGSQTFNNGPFTVANMSPAFLSGILKVDKRTQLNASLEVFGPTKLNSTLIVDNQGIALFPSELKGAVKISDETQSDGTVEIGTYPDPVRVVVDAGKGALVVDGGAGVKKNFNVGGDFAVQGSAAFGGAVDFYSPLSVKASEESETIWVGDSITGALRVYGGTGIRGKLNVGNDFRVKKQPVTVPYTSSTDPSDVFLVDAAKGQVTIKSDLVSTTDPVPDTAPSTTTHDKDYNNYPLRIEGGSQGIAVKVKGSRSNKNNFVSFWDDSQMWGRIEGEIPSEFNNNADHVFDTKGLDYSEFDAEVAYGFAAANVALTIAQLNLSAVDLRVCAGFPVNCVTTPGPADIAFAIAEIASAAVQLGFAANSLVRANELTDIYNNNKTTLQGVTYASGAGDYAEYLLRSDTNEKIASGDIVGIIGGAVTLNASSAERVMVVSSKPIVLGNMPQPGMENLYEKVAFIGQVPVKVFGKVNIGDYIVPSENNDGIGIAIHPSEITSQKIKNIVGVAWTESEITFGYNSIIVSVGLNSNDSNPVVEKLEKEVEQLDVEIVELEESLSVLLEFIRSYENVGIEKGIAAEKNISTDHEIAGVSNNRKFTIKDTEEGEVISWEITEEDFETALVFLEDMYKENDLDFENDIVFKKIKNDLNYKNQMFESVREKMQELFHEHNEEYHNAEKH